MSSDNKNRHGQFISLQDSDDSSISISEQSKDNYDILTSNTMTLKIDLHNIISEFDNSISRDS